MKNERKGWREGERKEERKGRLGQQIDKIQGWYGLREKEPLVGQASRAKVSWPPVDLYQARL